MVNSKHVVASNPYMSRPAFAVRLVFISQFGAESIAAYPNTCLNKPPGRRPDRAGWTNFVFGRGAGAGSGWLPFHGGDLQVEASARVPCRDLGPYLGMAYLWKKFHLPSHN